MLRHFSAGNACFAAVALLLGSLARAASVTSEMTPPAPAISSAGLAASTAAFVEPLLASLSIEEKVAQMIQADIASITPEDLATYPLGSVLAGGNAAPHDDVRCAPRDWSELVAAFHRVALRNSTHTPIPVMFGIDAVHGNAKLIGATIFPHNVGLGAAHDPTLLRDIGAATAEEVAAVGIDWTFAPTVAVARDVRWGRSYESYSESADLVGDYAAAMVQGLQGDLAAAHGLGSTHTLASVKHFIGDGGTNDGRDQGDTVLPEEQLLATHAAGYLTALRAGALIVMASYNSWNGTKAHASHYLLTELLKGRLGFEGFVVGDWNAHEQIPGCTKTDCALAILAGVDMLMAPDGWKALYENTLAEVRSGAIPLSRIDDAVRRILRVKVAAGLFATGAHEPELEALGAAAHRALARRAVRESLVLLKNEHSLLPLDPHARILIAGEGADDIGMQSGGWTIDWQGNRNSSVDFPGATSIYRGIERAVNAAGGQAILSRDGHYRERPDVAIVVYGERPYAEFEGDRETLAFGLGDRHALELLRSFRAANIPTVSVFLSGRPLWVNPELNASDAFVAAWLPGSEGEGLADVLLRRADGAIDHDFTGRLGFSWPATAMPPSFGPQGEVTGALFARGNGLDYAHPTSLSTVPEDPRIAPRFSLSPEDTLFAADHPVAPWSVFVEDGGAQVHLTSAKQLSPHGVLTATRSLHGLAALWNGTESATLRISGPAVNLTPALHEGRVLEIRYRIEARPDSPVVFGIDCTRTACGRVQSPSIDITERLRRSPLHEWRTLELPLACLGAQELSDVEVPFSLLTRGRFELTIAALRWSTPRARGTCP